MTETNLEICRCTNFSASLSGAHGPCAQIVSSQAHHFASVDSYHVPEPWSGHIATARILFLTKNPSIVPGEEFPTVASKDDVLVDYFENRFGGGRKAWTRNGTEALMRDGTYNRSNKTWAELKARAGEILGRAPVPGEDYAVSDIVHCKSVSSFGVSSAIEECPRRHLKPVLRAFGGAVVVATSASAAHLSHALGVAAVVGRVLEVVFENRRLCVVGIGQPGSNLPRSIPGCLANGAADLDLIRRYLDGAG